MKNRASVYPDLGKTRNKAFLLAYFGIFLLAGLGATAIVAQNYPVAGLVGLLPLAGLLSFHFIRHPHLALSALVAFHLFQFEMKVSFLTINIILTLLCVASLIINKTEINLVVDRRFLFWISLYLVLVIFSYAINTRDFEYYGINIYINNFLLLNLFFVFNQLKKIIILYKTIVLCGVVLVFMGIAQIAFFGLPPQGMTGFYHNHVEYALYISFGIPISVFLLSKEEKKLPYALSTFILIAGTFLAYSRGVLLALLLASAVGVFLFRYVTSPSRQKIHALGWTGLLVTASFLVLAVSLPLVEQVERAELNTFTSGRTILYEAGWEMFKEKPVLGVGWDRYQEIWGGYADIRRPRYGSFFGDQKLNPHSSYLKILVELGTLGFLIYLIFNFYLVRTTWKTFFIDAGKPLFVMLLIYYFHGVVDNNSYGNERMFYVICGLLYSLKKIHFETQQEAINDE